MNLINSNIVNNSFLSPRCRELFFPIVGSAMIFIKPFEGLVVIVSFVGSRGSKKYRLAGLEQTGDQAFVCLDQFTS